MLVRQKRILVICIASDRGGLGSIHLQLQSKKRINSTQPSLLSLLSHGSPTTRNGRHNRYFLGPGLLPAIAEGLAAGCGAGDPPGAGGRGAGRAGAGVGAVELFAGRFAGGG